MRGLVRVSMFLLALLAAAPAAAEFVHPLPRVCAVLRVGAGVLLAEDVGRGLAQGSASIGLGKLAQGSLPAASAAST
jgi:hypothetical protein